MHRTAFTTSLAALALVSVALPRAWAASDPTALKGKAGAPPSQMIAVGAAPIPFALQDLEGKTVKLSDFLGKKAVLLGFWSFFCGPCREEMPVLDELAKKFGPQGLEVVTVNLDGPKLEKAVRKYMEAGPYSFRVLWEEFEGTAYKTADSYGVLGTPSVLLISKAGKVSWTHAGREETPVLEAEIRKALGSK